MSHHEIPYEDLFDAIASIVYPADQNGHCEFCDAYVGFDDTPEDDHYQTCLWQRIRAIAKKEEENE